MGRRPAWATGPTKKQIQAALRFYSGNILVSDVKRLRAEKFEKALTKMRSAVKLARRKGSESV